MSIERSKPNKNLFKKEKALLGQNHLEKLLLFVNFNEGYDLNKMLSYIVEHTIPVEDLLDDWNETTKNNSYYPIKSFHIIGVEYSYESLLPYMRILDAIKDLNVFDLNDSLGILKELGYDTNNLFSIIKTLKDVYYGNFEAMLQKAEEGDLKMEEEEMPYELIKKKPGKKESEVRLENEEENPIVRISELREFLEKNPVINFNNTIITLTEERYVKQDNFLKTLEEEEGIKLAKDEIILNDNDKIPISKEVLKMIEEYEGYLKVEEPPIIYLMIIITEQGQLRNFISSMKNMIEGNKLIQKKKQIEIKQEELRKKEEDTKKKEEEIREKEEILKKQKQDAERKLTEEKKKEEEKTKDISELTSEKKGPEQSSISIPNIPGEQENKVNEVNPNGDIDKVENDKEKERFEIPEILVIDKEGTIKVRLDRKPLDLRLLYTPQFVLNHSPDDIKNANKDIIAEGVAKTIYEYKRIMNINIASFWVILLLLGQQGLLNQYKEILKKKIEEKKRNAWDQINWKQIESPVSQQMSVNDITGIQLTANQYIKELQKQEIEEKRKKIERERMEKMPENFRNFNLNKSKEKQKKEMENIREQKRTEILKRKRFETLKELENENANSEQ